MVNIEIETASEPFEPSPIRPATYGETRSEAWAIINASRPQSGEDAIASAILALAAQVARLADVAEYKAMTGDCA